MLQQIKKTINKNVMSTLIIIGGVVGVLALLWGLEYILSNFFGPKRPKAIDDLEKLSEFKY